MTETTELITGGIDSWVSDIRARTDHEFYRPIIQTEVIPLACVWSLSKVKLGKSPTCFDFAQDIMAHDSARNLWRERAQRAGDIYSGDDTLPYDGMLQAWKNAGDYSPRRFEVRALEDGRPLGQEFISGTEFSLLSALGHAAYNSTSGSVLITLYPLGPPENSPTDFLMVTDDAVRKHVEDNGLLQIKK